MDPTRSRRYWREAIRRWLEQWDPVHDRWLQEHLRRPEILNMLTTETIELWLHATRQRTNPPAGGTYWLSIPADDVHTVVITQTLESPGVVAGSRRGLPAQRTTLGDPPAMLSLIPRSGPPRPRSPRHR